LRVARLSKQIHRLFLRLLNFTPALVAKAQEEAELQHTGIDVLMRDALEKHLRELEASRKEEEAETIEYARLVLRAHFAEDRNEFLAEDAIRRIGR
jgi:phosphopantothenate synthetase